MAKAPSVEDRLADLARLGKSPDSSEARAQLRNHLASKVSLVAATAADVVRRIEDHDSVPDLVAAFHRFMIDPVKTDKGCVAKIAVVKALLAAESDEEEIYLAGIRHVQLEPTWGGRADTAAPLRALSALGLVQSGAPECMNELAVLLADAEADARIGAARALAHCGPAGAPLLRFKMLSGDAEPAVLAECLNGLMMLSPSGSFAFVARFVDPSYPSVYEHAALALSESRLPEAFALLKEKWSSTFSREFRQALLLPIALTRSEAACEFVISVLESGELNLATAAISALSIYRGDPAIRQRAENVIAGPNKVQLLEALARAFE
jgi:HEAT repeat protein